MISQRQISLAVCIVVCLATWAGACEIPVFRYALQRWEPDSYLLIVAHRGELNPGERNLVSLLEQTVRDGRSTLNLDLRIVDLSQSKAPMLEKVLKEKTNTIQSPQMVLIFPFVSHQPLANSEIPAAPAPSSAEPDRTLAPRNLTAAPPQLTPVPPGQTALTSSPADCPTGVCAATTSEPKLAWTGSLTAHNIQRLMQSPARQTIAARILEGESAVWVFLESEDVAKNETALKRLERALNKMEQTLELPDQQEIRADEHYESDTKVKLRIAFSVVRIPHNTADDDAFASMLRNLDPKATMQQPLAIAVFGRGRSYRTLVGEDINESSVEDHCRFLTGDCSCQVKQANFGTDLLLPMAWRDHIKESTEQQAMPELSGFELAQALSADLDFILPQPNPSAGQNESQHGAQYNQTGEIESAVAKTSREKSTTYSGSSPGEEAPDFDSPSPAQTNTNKTSATSQLKWMLIPAAISLIVITAGGFWLRILRHSLVQYPGDDEGSGQ